jgi:hypothetical protein
MYLSLLFITVHYSFNAPSGLLFCKQAMERDAHLEYPDLFDHPFHLPGNLIVMNVIQFSYLGLNIRETVHGAS